jgi:hypothetical protein
MGRQVKSPHRQSPAGWWDSTRRNRLAWFASQTVTMANGNGVAAAAVTAPTEPANGTVVARPEPEVG